MNPMDAVPRASFLKLTACNKGMADMHRSRREMLLWNEPPDGVNMGSAELKRIAYDAALLFGGFRIRRARPPMEGHRAHLARAATMFARRHRQAKHFRRNHASKRKGIFGRGWHVRRASKTAHHRNPQRDLDYTASAYRRFASQASGRKPNRIAEKDWRLRLASFPHGQRGIPRSVPRRSAVLE